MIYSPLIGLLDDLVKWMKKKGSWLYWGWIGIIAMPALLIGVGGRRAIIGESSWESIKLLGIFMGLFFLLTVIPVFIHERSWKKAKH